MDSTILKMLLLELATEIDANGTGSGAVLLYAICQIDDLEHRIRPADPSL